MSESLSNPETLEPDDRAALDEHYPWRGECFLCGADSDARHRLWDALMDRHKHAHESVAELMEDYDLSRQAVEVVLRVRPYEIEDDAILAQEAN